MSDFPALDDHPTTVSPDLENIEDTDFLKREQEILGDEFKTEKDDAVVNDLNGGEDEEVNVFNQQFPELDGESKQNFSNNEEEENVVDDDEFADFEEAKKVTGNESSVHTPSEAIENWKKRRDLEIIERDEQDLAKKEALKKEAIEQVHLLYEEYENKKLNSLKETKLQAEEFEKERQNFFKENDSFDAKSNVSWKKSLQLLDDLDSLSENVGGRDRSKFKDLLIKLSSK
ncbi:hypothetical protein HANVADRAFT_84486 [Hanseniaspora valbyensis NRRL Y-1626]|uniref:Clathrin light chain n=1 Tax=Hanseniaspora valbyensis NRRL Y-1626 TaxID=766949 RepID=A0A1B7TJH2_9ASCO|nr:hypothetical protein HANVADRAFT_84486 [Hanseniaspora valbyensis NRRL Y-1626]